MACTVFETNAGCSSPVVLDQHPGRLPRRPARQHLPLVRRRRRAQRRHRRLRRRQLLRPGLGHARADGRVPSQGRARLELRAALLHGPLHRRRRARADSPSTGSSSSPSRASRAVAAAPTICPNNPVRRDQMAVFLLKASEGSSYVPPTATGTIFTDVPASAFAADWIEDLYSRNVTGGCLTNPLRYCPGTPTTASRWRCSSRRRSGCSRSSPARWLDSSKRRAQRRLMPASPTAAGLPSLDGSSRRRSGCSRAGNFSMPAGAPVGLALARSESSRR